MAAPFSAIEPLESRIAPAFSATISLGSVDGHNGFKLSGGAELDHAGFSVGDAGDVNGDGFADVIVGAFLADSGGHDSGAAYVIFGGVGGFMPNLDLSKLDGHNGFRLSGADSANAAGISVSGAGDVNGDGFDDLLIGAYNAGDFPSRGAAYVVFGKAGGFAADLNLAQLNGSNGFRLAGSGRNSSAGYSVDRAGDVNGDGFADVIVGVPGDSRDNLAFAGAAYVVFGKAGGFAASMDLDGLNGSDGFKLSGAADRDYAGASVSGAGDVNDDGFADVIVGAPMADPNGDKSGAAYVVFGKAGGFAAELNLAALDGNNGFKLTGGAAGNQAASARNVSGVGDINGDGFGDVIVSAFRASPNGTASGAAYLIFGKAGGFAASLELAALDGSNGFQLSGIMAFDAAGASVSGAGDVNGDGFLDLLIGASAAPSASFTGAAFVVFGKATGFPANFQLASLDGRNGFRLNGVGYDHAGFSLSNAGDVNGDGFDDVIIGAFGNSSRGNFSGAAYVFFGGNLPGLANITMNGHRATFTDIDGDLVTVTTTKGKLTAAMFDLHAQNLGYQLEKLDLTAPAFAGANITITAALHNADGVPGKEGNGMVNIGYLDATGVALGKVKLPGDLGQIHAGAVQVLNLGSLGALGTATQDPAAPSLHSDLTGNLGKLTLHGNLSGATLAVAGKIGPVNIAGDVDDATLTALGTLAPANATDAVAIACVNIGGHVANSQILAGYDLTGAALNADVSIGKIIVQGNWLASSVVAGVADSTQDGFGQNDTLIPGGSDSIIAKIASITIKGTATGSAGAGDFFGITAERIKKAKINGLALALTPNKDDLPLDAANNDFRLVEV